MLDSVKNDRSRDLLMRLTDALDGESASSVDDVAVVVDVAADVAKQREERDQF